MSGDRIMKTPLPTSKLSAEDVKGSETPRETARKTIITVSANGHEIQSSLNPNALEFIPCYLQKLPQIPLNEEIYDNIERKKSSSIQHDPDKKLEQNDCDITEKHGTQDISEELLNFGRMEKNDMTESQVHVLFANSSAVVNTSSETVRSVLSASEMENYFLDVQKKEHYEKKEESFVKDLEAIHVPDFGIQDVYQSVRIDGKMDKNENMNFNKGNIQLNLLFTTSTVVNSSTENIKSILAVSGTEHCIVGNPKEDVDICNGSKIIEDTSEKLYPKEGTTENQIAESYLSNKKNFLEENMPKPKDLENLKLEIINESNTSNTDCIEIEEYFENCNETDMEIKSPGHKQIVSTVVNDAKKILNVNSKIATVSKPTTGKITKLSLAKTHEKDIKHKTEPMIVQNSNSSKFSKCPSLIPSKPCSKPFKKEPTKSFNRDTISNTVSNKLSTSTEKSLTPNKFCAINTSTKYAENPTRFGAKPKECVQKSPRATVSSKLRKAETQKRRNLFFELDTIKMSEFLFK